MVDKNYAQDRFFEIEIKVTTNSNTTKHSYLETEAWLFHSIQCIVTPPVLAFMQHPYLSNIITIRITYIKQLLSKLTKFKAVILN